MAALDEVGRSAGEAVHLGDRRVFGQVHGNPAVFDAVVAGVVPGTVVLLQMSQAPLVEIGSGLVGLGDAVRHPAGQEPSRAFPGPVERVFPLVDRGGVLVAGLFGG
jgi:hypothetical protein